MPETLPAGFRRSVESGLILPEPHSRAREVWTRAEWKILERATKLLRDKGIQLYLRCNQSDCQKEPMERRRQPDGGITLRCAHKDRVCYPGL